MNRGKFTEYLTDRTAEIQFLALNVIFDILLVVFWTPTVLLDYTTQQSSVGPIGQIVITVVACLLTVIVSRVLMVLIGRNRLTASSSIIWLLSELILCIAASSMALWIASGCGKMSLAPLAGDLTLGVLAIEMLPYIISFLFYLLRESQEEVERLRALLPQEAVNEPIGPDCNINFYEKGGRLAFATGRSNVLYIEAANNYSNIHYLNDDKEDTFILHNTMKELESTLTAAGLVRCHRSFMVNVENVKLMRKDGTGLLLEMTGTSKVIPVTKTYARTFADLMQNIGL